MATPTPPEVTLDPITLILAELQAIRHRIEIIDPPAPPPLPRYALPLVSKDTKTGMPVKVKRGQKVEIVARPQHAAFRPERLFISGFMLPVTRWSRFVNWLKDRPANVGTGAWLVHDIQIGHRSQFAQSGALPGDMFSSTAADSFLHFDTAQSAMDVTLIVEYVGPHKDACFHGAMLGVGVPYASEAMPAVGKEAELLMMEWGKLVSNVDKRVANVASSAPPAEPSANA